MQPPDGIGIMFSVFMTSDEVVFAIETCGISVSLLLRGEDGIIRRTGPLISTGDMPTGRCMVLRTVDVDTPANGGQPVSVDPRRIIGVYVDNEFFRVANVRYDDQLQLWGPR